MQLVRLIALKSLNAPDWLMGALSAAPPAGMFFGVFWGSHVARGNKVPFVFYPELVAALLMACVFFAKSSGVFAVLIVLVLATSASLHPAQMGIWRLNYPPHRRSSIFASALLVMMLGSALIALAYGRILDLEPSAYRVLFPASAVFTAMAAFQFRRIRVSGENTQGNGIAPHMNFRRMISILAHDRRFRRYECSVFLFGLANIFTLPVLPIFLEEEFRVSYAQGSLALATIPQLLMVVGLPVWGVLLDRRNPLLIRAIANLMMLAFPLTCAFAPNLTWIYVAVGIRGLFQGGSGLVWNLGVNYFSNRFEVSAYSSVHQFLTGIRGLGGPFIALALLRVSFIGARGVFAISTVVGAIGISVLLFEVWREWRTHGLRDYSQAEEARDLKTSEGPVSADSG